MPKRKYTKLKDHHETIVRMASQGSLPSEIAAEIGCSYVAVRNYCRQHDIPYAVDRSRWKNPGRPSSCAAHHETVVAMAQAGATLQSIAEAVGSNHHRVREYLIRHEIQRPAWREPPSDHPMSRNTSGSLNSAWKGGRNLDRDGYVLVWMPGHPEATKVGYVREHRIVMAKMIGRPLLPGEVVDHRNDVRDDNRPENLRLFSSNGEHLSVTLTGRWSRASRGLPPSTRKSSRRDDQT